MSKHNDWDIDPRTDDFYINSELYGYDRNSDDIPSRNSRDKFIETHIIIFCSLSGVFIQVLLYMILGIEVEDVPVIVKVLLWWFFSGLTTVCAACLYNRARKR